MIFLMSAFIKLQYRFTDHAASGSTDPVKQGSYMAVIAQIIRASAVNWDSRSHAHTHIHIRFIGNAHLHQFCRYSKRSKDPHGCLDFLFF